MAKQKAQLILVDRYVDIVGRPRQQDICELRMAELLHGNIEFVILFYSVTFCVIMFRARRNSKA